MCNVQRIEKHLERWPEAENGPAHVVFGDCNIEDEHLAWCLSLIDSLLDGTPWPEDPKTFDPAMYAHCDREELQVRGGAGREGGMRPEKMTPREQAVWDTAYGAFIAGSAANDHRHGLEWERIIQRVPVECAADIADAAVLNLRQWRKDEEAGRGDWPSEIVAEIMEQG